MQEEIVTNPFKSLTKLLRVEFNTIFKHIPLLELIFEDISVATSSYEISSKSVESMPDDTWRYICYFEIDIKVQDIRKLAIDYINGEILITEEVENDWVSIVQAEASAVYAGYFYVANSELISNCPNDLIPLQINAGRAFGTGEHSTTKGCLEMISKISIVPDMILDVGTGTGILSIAAKKLWANSIVHATDIDSVAIEIAADNAKLNNVDIEFSLSHHNKKLHNYDIIVSNILFKPLIEMSDDFKKLLKPNGLVILSGFIKNQLDGVIAAYTKHNLYCIEVLSIDDWQIIMLGTKKPG